MRSLLVNTDRKYLDAGDMLKLRRPGCLDLNRMQLLQYLCIRVWEYCVHSTVSVFGTVYVLINLVGIYTAVPLDARRLLNVGGEFKGDNGTGFKGE